MATKPIRKVDYATAAIFFMTMVFALVTIITVAFTPPAKTIAERVKESPPIVQCYKPTYFERVVLHKQDTTNHILCR